MDGSGEGAVGIIDHRTAAEYKSSVSADAYHLVVYDSNTGTLLASVYDSNMETFENYTLNSSGRDGAAVMMALFPMLMQDDEFKENFEAYQDELNAGYPHMDKATEYMVLMCDNAYRRIKDDSCAAHIKVNVDKAGNLMRVSQTHLDSGSFTPTTVLAGEFKIFAQTGPAQIYSATETIDHVDFEGQYVLNKRTFSPQEAMLIPKLPEWYIIPKEVVDICKHAKATTGKSMQMRNFLLRGPAGTGKTMGAKAIAAGLGLPYMKYTCSANTEIFDFVGMIFPDSADGSTGSAQLDAERETLMQMGGINYANVSKLMKLPDLDDTMQSVIRSSAFPASSRKVFCDSSRRTGAAANRPALLWGVVWMRTLYVGMTARCFIRTTCPMKFPSLQWDFFWMSPVLCAPATAALTPERQPSSYTTFVKALRFLLWYMVTRPIAMSEKIRLSFTPMPSSTVLTMTISTG